MDNDVVVLVEDPEQLFRESRFDHGARLLMQQRPQKTGAKHSALLLYAGSQSRFQWENFDPQFVAALPVLEAYSNKAKPAAGQQLRALMIPPSQAQVARDLCDVDPESSTKRTDPALAFRFIFTLLGQNPQFIGVLQEIPDLCGEDWQEWVHPPRDHAGSLQPFRQYGQNLIIWQPSIINYRPPNWRIDSEEDSPQSRRNFERDIAPFRQTHTVVLGPFPAVMLGIQEFEGVIAATGLGSIRLAWSASPGAQGYRLYTNGIAGSRGTTALLTASLVAGAALAYTGYGSGFGTLSPATDWNANPVALLADGSGTFNLTISSAASLGANYFDALTISGSGLTAALFPSNASYQYGAGNSVWIWPDELGLAAGNAYAVTFGRSIAFAEMPATQQQLTITGLPLNTQFQYAIVPTDSYGNDAAPLSNVVTWEHSSTELKYVQNLSSDNPDEGL